MKSYSLEMLKLERSQRHCNIRSDKDDGITDEIITLKTDSVEVRPFLGMIFMLLHAISNQLSSVIIKSLWHINPNQLSFFRNVAIFAGTLPITIYHTSQILGMKKDRIILLLGGLSSCTAVYMQIIAYSYLPLAEASIILSTYPIVTAVIACMLLKESYGLTQSISLIMTVCGVLLALRIPDLLSKRNTVNFDSTYVGGSMAAVGFVLLTSLTIVCIRKQEKVHFSIKLIYLSVVGIAENSIISEISIPFARLICSWDQILIILFGIFSFAAATFFTLAFHVEPAGLGAVQKSSFDILISIPFQIIFFNIYADMYVICGACLVIMSLISEGIRNWILAMPEKSKVKRTFKWLL